MRRAFLPAWIACAAAALAAATRPAAPWPPAGPVRVILDADAANEVDDQFALALAFGFPERFRIEGLVAAHFGDAGGAGGISKSQAEIERLLALAGLSGKFPVKRGTDPLQYRDRPPSSESVDFIIERARAASPEDPLWLVLLGPATDAAAALLKEPAIADRLVVFWHGRTQWPLRCWNFNAYNDTRAARRFAPLGPLGNYLHQIRSRDPRFASPRKGFFDLGDTAAIADPSCALGDRRSSGGRSRPALRLHAQERPGRKDLPRGNGACLRPA